MAMITIDKDGNKIDTTVIKMVFVCDRCGNTFPFRHGMETFRLNYSEGLSGSSDNRSFCSQLCVVELIREEGGIIRDADIK
jgi:hypothetical protein